MNNCSIIYLLVLTTVFHMYLAQLNLVPIKSHKVITSMINSNQIQAIYDNKVDTIGSFYSATDRDVEVEFDLGKNYLIQHVLIRMKKEKSAHRLSLSVGNTIGSQGSLPYVCELFNESEEIYKCQPVCQSKDTQRPGIIARKFVMKLLIPSRWVSVYDMEVFSSPMLVSDDISSNRPVLPLSCTSQPWLLTDKVSPANKSLATTTETYIYFEKPYIVTELVVEFQNAPPKILEIALMNGASKNVSILINLSDCISQKSLFTCTIDKKTFASTFIKIQTTGLIKIFIRGKAVFYPQLKMKTSTNVKEKLQMSCEYSQCDLSVHSDCSPETIKAGVKFECVNKRLIRTPSGSDLDSYIIVNRGKVEPEWQTTKFSVNTDSDERMTVSMPRGYQYFGQYKCSCVVGDQINTEITSDITDLKESDFLEDLIFETLVQYKLSDSDESVFNNASNNVIYVPKSKIESAFLPVKITLYSLVAGNSFTVTFPVNEKDIDNAQSDRSTTQSIKAFKSIPQSWSVATHKYVIDEIFPELIHGHGISISCQSVTHKRQVNEFIRMLDADKVKLTPSIWSTDDGAKTMQINIMYANIKDVTLYHEDKNCINTNTSVLATFTNDNCIAKDTRLACSKIDGSMFVTFKDERNFAKKIVLDLKDTITNNTIERFVSKSNVTLNQEDVIVKPSYTSLVSSSTSKFNIVKVAVEVISKKISDFIPCGGVNVKIMIPGKDEQKMILQKSKFEIDIEMKSKTINMTIELSIDKVNGKHEAMLQITDPTTFSAKNLEFQEDQTLNLLWHGIDDVARDFLQSYELKIVTTTLACDSNTTDLKSIQKSQISGAKNRYQAPMAVINQKHLSSMVVIVQPVFTGDKRGQAVTVQRKFGAIGQTAISIDDVALPTERTISVISSQSDIACDINDVEFTVTGINVEKVQWKSAPLGNMKYKISNLVPGRNYQLTAKVLYKKGPADHLSKVYTFETADDISVLKTKHVAQINEFVNISCTAEIGPADKFKKVVEWLRADKSLLPDGVKSVTSASNPKIAFLIMEKALADYSGEYRCFAKPSASTGSAKITIVVNDLVVSPMEQRVDFSKQRNVSVTCSSSAVGKNNLVWVDPFGTTIAETESNKYSIKKMITDQNVFKSTLMIKNASLDTSGVYKCHKSVDNLNANKEFLLYGKEKMEIKELPTSSNFVGEKLRLRCSATPALKTQKVMWESVTLKGDSINIMETSFPDPMEQTTQDIAIINSLAITQVICKLSPSMKEDSPPLTITSKIVLRSKIVVNGPAEVKEGSIANLKCTGYHTDKNTKLKWIFYPTQNASGSVVKVSVDSPNQKSYEPIKLDLNLAEAKINETGRYECKFIQEARGPGERFGKSVSLVIKPANKYTNNDNPKKSAHTIASNSFLTVLFTAVVLVSFRVYHRS